MKVKQLAIMVSGLLFAGMAAAGGTAEAKRPLKVLMIGNSFSAPLAKALPERAAEFGVEMDLCSLYIGGCTLDRHVRNLRDEKEKAYFITWSYSSCKGSAEPPFRPLLVQKDGGWFAALAEMLSSDRWDVVTVQQGSHDSWRAETYEPYGTELLEGIRRLAPGAKICVHETWSYTPWDQRLAKWGITAGEMYEKLHAAYGGFAARHGLEVIPVGTAVQLYRSRLPVCYGEKRNHDDVCGTDRFRQLPDGSWVPDGDVFHFNPRGHVLQSFVWLAKVFGVDVRKGDKDDLPCLAGEPERVRLMREVAMDAVNGMEWHRVPAKDFANPVIDLGGESGLYPLVAEHHRYFCNAKTDLLHPNAAGHRRMAETILRNLSRIPRFQL